MAGLFENTAGASFSVPWWPFNFGDNLSEQLVRIETKQDWIIKAFTDATAQSGAIDMGKLHDHLADLAKQLDAKADQVIAEETANETAFQDVITKLESTIEKLQKKLDDDASEGGSTGGGSGSGGQQTAENEDAFKSGSDNVSIG